MNRRSRGSFFLTSSQAVEDDHTQTCVKELQRHYDSIVVFTGIYEDGEAVHASAMGVSGILVHKPVVDMETGDRIKGTPGLCVSTLLHEFCSGKVFLLKLLLPHHPAAKDELGPKYDQVNPSAYVKTAEFLLNSLKNVNMTDSNGKTALKRLLERLARQDTCATNWIPLLQFLLQSGAHLKKAGEQSSAVTLLYSLAENNFCKKTCGDKCEIELVRLLAGQAEKEAVDRDSLRDVFQNKNRFLAEILENLN